jgi:hypothetical protein
MFNRSRFNSYNHTFQNYGREIVDIVALALYVSLCLITPMSLYSLAIMASISLASGGIAKLNQKNRKHTREDMTESFFGSMTISMLAYAALSLSLSLFSSLSLISPLTTAAIAGYGAYAQPYLPLLLVGAGALAEIKRSGTFSYPFAMVTSLIHTVAEKACVSLGGIIGSSLDAINYLRLRVKRARTPAQVASVIDSSNNNNNNSHNNINSGLHNNSHARYSSSSSSSSSSYVPRDHSSSSSSHIPPLPIRPYSNDFNNSSIGFGFEGSSSSSSFHAPSSLTSSNSNHFDDDNLGFGFGSSSSSSSSHAPSSFSSSNSNPFDNGNIGFEFGSSSSSFFPRHRKDNGMTIEVIEDEDYTLNNNSNSSSSSSHSH